MMRLRRSTVEHPFASLKYRIFGTSTISAPWTARCPGGDQPSHDGLQLKPHAECAGRQSAASGASRIISAIEAQPTELRQKAMSGVSEHRLFNFEPAVS
jgi:hypothetical protein